MSEILQGLNPEQRGAVEQLHGPLLILAGAGSGKTRVLTRRLAHLLEENRNLAPWNVLAVTFTNKAAQEMRHRVGEIIGDRVRYVWIGTFHATCVRILRRDIEALGYRKDFVIYDDDDQLRLLKDISKESDLRINPKEMPPGQLRARIDRAKNALKGPADFPPTRGDPFQQVFLRYESRMKSANALDFNDIINKVVDLWEKRVDILANWQDQFKYVMVDEYQDTNAAQYRLVKLLVDTPHHRNLAVVGDDDQSIYSFRGADIRNILDFENDFPEATVVRLEQNYRSTANILRAASGVVKHNSTRKEKTIWTDAEAGEPLRKVIAENEGHEAELVVSTIRGLLRQGRKPSDFAIIFRTNAQSRPLEQALSSNRIPFILIGGRKFYERQEVRDLLGYLRLILNPSDDMAFLRVINVPSRGIGDKSVTMIQEEAALLGMPLLEAARRKAMSMGRAGAAVAAFVVLIDHFSGEMHQLPPGNLVIRIARETGYLPMLEAEDTDESKGRIENIQALAEAAAAATGDTPFEQLITFMDQSSLSGQADELPGEGNGAVTMLTAHLAKGLEYPVVFVVGMAEGSFPHSRSEKEEAVEEERRLAYVALTRARELLFVSYPQRRRFLDGSWGDSRESRFLQEIPPEAFGLAPIARPARPPPVAPTRPPAPWTRPPLPPPRPPTAMGAFRNAGLSARPGGDRPSPQRPGRSMTPESPESFQVGTRVFHPLLGVGTISLREGIPNNPKLTIHFEDHGPRTVYAASAQLEVLL